jgi:transcriptional regulator with XRE-family HTH domain
MEMAKLQLQERLLHYRRAKNLTQKELGAKVGVSGKTVSHWETGHRTPGPAVLAEIAKAYEISLDELTIASAQEAAAFNRAAASVGLNAAPPLVGLISSSASLVNLIAAVAPKESPLFDAAALVAKSLGRVRDVLPPAEREQATHLIRDVGRRFGVDERDFEAPTSH